MKLQKSFFVLACIFFLSLFLNSFRLKDFPVGLHIDTVRVGYNAFSLLKTGRDSHGNFLPLYYDSFGDFRPAGLIYLTVPSVAFFGLNEFSVRFPAALFGALSVFLIYAVVNRLFGKSNLALLSAFFFSITPWQINMARTASEAVFALFFVLLGIYFFIGKRVILSTFFLGLSFFFYHSVRLFVPLLSLSFIFINYKSLALRYKTFLSLFFLIGLALFLIFGVSGGTGRIRQTFIFFNPGIQQQTGLQIQDEGPGKIFTARVFHNKVVNYSLEFARQYLRYFSAEFLFLDGGKPVRYVTQRNGLLPFHWLPFFVLGVYFCLKRRGNYYFVLYYLLTAPIVAALTLDDFVPNIGRSYLMLPALTVICAVGVLGSYQAIKSGLFKKTFISGFILLTCLSLLFYLHHYYNHLSPTEIVEHDVAATELGKKVSLFKNRGQLIIASQLVPTYEHVSFYAGVDPVKFQQVSKSRKEQLFQLENFTFFMDHCPSVWFIDKEESKKAIFFDSAICDDNPAFRTIDSVSDKKGNVFFKIRERI